MNFVAGDIIQLVENPRIFRIVIAKRKGYYLDRDRIGGLSPFSNYYIKVGHSRLLAILFGENN